MLRAGRPARPGGLDMRHNLALSQALGRPVVLDLTSEKKKTTEKVSLVISFRLLHKCLCLSTKFAITNNTESEP